MRDPPKTRRLLYICDWLPPDFGAVGQYAELFARQYAQSGMDVVLAGLSSKQASETLEQHAGGSLKTIKLFARPYQKDDFAARLFWTFKTNTRLVFSLWSTMRWTDEILFTGSPPMLLHWIAPLNLILRKRLIYRITDFHPECLIAARRRPSVWLTLVYRLTLYWRRHVDMFEVLGNDQRMRLEQIGISAERIRTKRHPSPVSIPTDTPPLPRPATWSSKVLLLYSGNWGVAHDYQTFVEAYRRHHQKGSGRVVLWHNAVGSAAGTVADALRQLKLPVVKTSPVPLDHLAQLLVTPDAHLITLLDAFVGFVLPSKVHGCIDSNKPILFVGSKQSDVHLLCSERVSSHYQQIEVGDVESCFVALERLADLVESKNRSQAG